MSRRYRARSPALNDDDRSGRRDTDDFGRDLRREERRTRSHSHSRSRSPRARSWSQSRSRSPIRRGSGSPSSRSRDKDDRRRHSPHREHYDDTSPSRNRRHWGGDRRRDDRDYDRRGMPRWEEDRRRGEGGMGMMTFRQFMETQPDDIDDTAALQCYSDYKAACNTCQLEGFFDAHAMEHWFQERYNPKMMEERNEQLKKSAQARLEVYLEMKDSLQSLDLEQESQDEVVRVLGEVNSTYEACLEAQTAPWPLPSTTEDVQEETATQDANTDDTPTDQSNIKEAEGEKEKEREGERERETEDTSNTDTTEATTTKNGGTNKMPATVNVMYIKNIPPTISRQDLWEVCQQVGPVLQISLGEPIAAKQFFRFAWATYSKKVNIREACEVLDNTKVKDYVFQCNPLTKPAPVRVKYAPRLAHHPQRVDRDLQQTAKMISLLDKCRGLWGDEVTNPLLSHTETETAGDSEPLDGEDGEEVEDAANQAKALQAKLKTLDQRILYLRVVHNYCYYGALVGDDEEDVVRRCGHAFVRTRPEGTDDKMHPEGWARSVDERVEQLTQTLDNTSEEKPPGVKDVEAEIAAFTDSKTSQMEREKFKCVLCGKMFKGMDFVRKHIGNKHQTDLAMIREKTAFFNNYVTDPARPAPMPMMGPMGPMGMGPMGPMFPCRPPMMNMQPPMPMPSFMGPPPGMRGPPPPMFGGPMRGRRGDRFNPYHQPMHAPPPPPGAQLDPRAAQIREYVDLDAPTGQANHSDFRDPVSYADL